MLDTRAYIGNMDQHAVAKDQIEEVARKREIHNIGLQKLHVGSWNVLSGEIHRLAAIYGPHSVLRTREERGVTPVSASRIQNAQARALAIMRVETELGFEPVVGFLAKVLAVMQAAPNAPLTRPVFGHARRC